MITKKFGILVVTFIAVFLGIHFYSTPSVSINPDCVCHCPKFNLSCPESVCPKPYCPEFSCPLCPKLPFFIKEAKTVANLGYHEDNCWWYAKELTRRLHYDGYEDVWYCIGIALWCKRDLLKEGYSGEYAENNCGHAWTKLGSIRIETTEGEIIEPKDFEIDYKEIQCYSATSEVVQKGESAW